MMTAGERKDRRQLRFPYSEDQAYPFLLRSSHPPAIFIHIPKTGGTSIVKALRMPAPDPASGIKKHNRGMFIQAHLPDELWQRAFKFAILRNPHERLFSHYQYRLKSGILERKRSTILPFSEWVKAELDPERPGNLRPQYAWVHDNAGHLLTDYLGRFDRLEEAFNFATRQLGLSPLPLPHYNKSPRADYRQHYDAESWDLAADFYRKDFTLLDGLA